MAKSQLIKPIDKEQILFRVQLCLQAGRSLTICQEQVARAWGHCPDLRAFVAKAYKKEEPKWPRR